MRVLHVIESLGVGGAERLLVTLLPALRHTGCEVAVAVLRGPHDLRPALEACGIAVIQLPARSRWNLLARAVDIARCARSRGCDVVHAHLYFPAVATALGRILGLHPAATLVSFHNLAYAAGVNKPGPGLRLRKWLASVLYPRGFDAMLGVSQAVASHYESALHLDKVMVLHNGVDLTEIDRVAAEPQAPAPAPGQHLLLPGRLVPEKGHADLLAALAQMRSAGALPRVTFAGGGPLLAAIQLETARLGLTATVSITGMLEHRAMLQLMRSADVVVIPSLAEGFGLTAAEAMALRRPVVASAVGGLPEVVEDGRTGILVPPGSPGQLAVALQTLLGDAALRGRLGAAGRESVERQFSMTAIAARQRALYDTLAPRSVAPAYGSH